MAANAALQRLGRNTSSRVATHTQMPRQTASHEIPALPESPTPPTRHAPKDVTALTAKTSLNALTTSDCSDPCSGSRTDHCSQGYQTPSLRMEGYYPTHLIFYRDRSTDKRFITLMGYRVKFANVTTLIPLPEFE